MLRRRWWIRPGCPGARPCPGRPGQKLRQPREAIFLSRGKNCWRQVKNRQPCHNNRFSGRASIAEGGAVAEACRANVAEHGANVQESRAIAAETRAIFQPTREIFPSTRANTKEHGANIGENVAQA